MDTWLKFISDILLCSLILYWIFRDLFRKGRIRESTALVPLAGCLAAVLVLSWQHEYLENPNTWNWVFIGIKNAFDVFGGDSEAFRESLSYIPAIPEILSFAIHLLTVLAALILLWNHLPHHVPLTPAVWHIFPEPDANSIRMAHSLNNPRHLCIFLRAKRTDLDAEVLSSLQDINYFLYPRDEVRFFLRPWRWQHPCRIYFLSENTDENFSRMRDLLDSLKGKKFLWPTQFQPADAFRQELYLLSETESAPMLIDHLRKMMVNGDQPRPIFAHTELQLLDRFRATGYDLLRTQPLWKFASEGQLNILVLGFGRIGREFFRAACSLGVLHDCNTTFTLCDQLIGRKLTPFQAQCPELSKSVMYQGRRINANSDSLDRLIKSKDFHYIVVALGDDELNIRTASRMMRHYRRCHWKYLAGEGDRVIQPMICVNIEDSIKHDYTTALWEKAELDGPTLHVFGGLDEIFTPKVLMPKELWEKARRLHRLLSGQKTPWDEYQRRSSIACAAHAEYLVDSLCSKDEHTTYSKQLSKLDLDQLTDTEHRRWMAYVRSEGLRLTSFEEACAYHGQSGTSNHVDILGQLSPCLVDTTAELDKLWNDLNRRWPDDYRDKPSFRASDRQVVEKAEYIVSLDIPPMDP